MGAVVEETCFGKFSGIVAVCIEGLKKITNRIRIAWVCVTRLFNVKGKARIQYKGTGKVHVHAIQA